MPSLVAIKALMPSNKPPVLNISSFRLPDHAPPDFYIKTLQEHQREHPFVIKPHSHDFYLLMVFTKGKGVHTIDGEEYEIKTGSAFFMSPSEIHSWKLSPDTDGYILFFNLSFYLFGSRSNNLFELPFYRPENKIRHGVLSKSALSNAVTLIKTILTESRTRNPNQTNILRSYLDILLLKFDLFLNSKTMRPYTHTSLIPKLEFLIESHFKDHLAASYYSDKLNITLPHLNAATKLLLNKSVSDLLHDRLTLEAKRLLLYSSLTVAQISDDLNYKDNSYFSRFFKKMTGVSPEQFRKQISTTQS